MDCICKNECAYYVNAKVTQAREKYGKMTQNEILREIADEMKKHGAPDDDISRVQIAFMYCSNEAFRNAVNETAAEMLGEAK